MGDKTVTFIVASSVSSSRIDLSLLLLVNNSGDKENEETARSVFVRIPVSEGDGSALLWAATIVATDMERSREVETKSAIGWAAAGDLRWIATVKKPAFSLQWYGTAKLKIPESPEYVFQLLTCIQRPFDASLPSKSQTASRTTISTGLGTIELDKLRARASRSPTRKKRFDHLVI